MKSRWLVNLVLLVLVAAAAGVLFFKREPSTASGHALSTLTPQAIQHIRIEKSGQPAVAFEKRGNIWHMTEPLAARADAHRIGGLLTLAQARSETRFAASDLARFELDKPLARVTLDQQTFSFGGTHPLKQQLYVQSGDAVYLVSAVYFTDIAKRVEDYLSKQLLPEGVQPVGFKSGAVTWQRIDGQWRRTPPKPDVSQDDANRFADAWRQALASSVSAQTGKALAVLELTLADGKIIPIDILQREPELILFRRDEKLAYRFGPETARQMLRMIE